MELNSNIEWWNYYVDYDQLKKLFPSTPLDPSYHSTNQQGESSSLLPTTRPTNKYATPEQFRFALDKEREKVTEFYKQKEGELHQNLDLLIDEISVLEARDLGTDDVIKEEDEDERSNVDEEEGHTSEGEALINYRNSIFASPAAGAVRPKYRPRYSLLGRLGGFGRRRSTIKNSDGADILEAAYAPALSRRRSSSQNRMLASVSTLEGVQEEGSMSPRSNLRPPGIKRQVSIDDDGLRSEANHDRRTSVSSASSHEPDFWSTRKTVLSLGLVEMEEEDIPSFVFSRPRLNGDAEGDAENGASDERPVFVWTANNDYSTVVRIGFKKRIAALWLEAYALKQYVDLNLTAFEKILKKFDKNTGNKVNLALVYPS